MSSTPTMDGSSPASRRRSSAFSLLILPRRMRARIEAEALAALPRECCGLIEGARDGQTAVALAVHPTANLAARPDRFEIDPAAQFALMRALRGAGRRIIGCYHSHPDGRAEPSARDADGAAEEGFVWVIAAVGRERDMAAFAYRGGGFEPLALAEDKR